MELHIPETEAEHDALLADIDKLMGEDNADRRRLDLLVLLSQTYETRHHPMHLPDPIAAIRSRMDDLGLQPANLSVAMGGRNRVSEVLRRVRPLTLPMIRRLSAQLGLPVSVLVQDYPLTERRPRSRAA